MIARLKRKDQHLSRRALLKGMGLASVMFRPAPLRGAGFFFEESTPELERTPAFLFSDHRLVPNYPIQSPLSDVLALVPPGSDEFIAERFAVEIESILRAWSEALKASIDSFSRFAEVLDPRIDGCILARSRDTPHPRGIATAVM